jgi:hypothetical protein
MTTMDRAKECLARITKELGEDIAAQSCINDGFVDVLHGLGFTPRCSLEIGTLRGLSAVALAWFSHSVVSIDVQRNADLDRVLGLAPRMIRERIATVVVPDNDVKAVLVANMNFQFAFIDGGHTVGQVSLDFGLARRCGTVLFHDYPASGSGCDGVGQVIDGLAEGDGQCELRAPFMWWRAK